MTKIQCVKCRDIIYSKHRHDMVWCKCGSIAIDGGSDYIKITGDPNNILDMTHTDDKTKQMNAAKVAAWELFKDE